MPVFLATLLLLGLLCTPVTAWAIAVDSCPIAREMTVKGIDLFEMQKDKGLKALQRAHELCPNDLSVSYNYGLALYLGDRKSEAADVWSAAARIFPDHLKLHANLAWVNFELGDDELSHILAFKSLAKYPNNMALIHTKLYSLFRLGRYLEAFDWLTRERPPGVRGNKWYNQSVSYVVESLWRPFRKGDKQGAVSKAVMMVKDYSEEPGLMAAKEEMVRAFIDPDAEIPFSQPLPHEFWPKNGSIDDEKELLDELVAVQPTLEKWEKRVDAYALIIGVTHYKRMPGRRYAQRDALLIQKLLENRSIIPNDKEHIRLRLDAQVTLDSLNDDIEWLLRRATLNPNAAIFFYFAGHGTTLTDANGQSQTLLFPYDLPLDNISATTTVSLRPIQETLNNLPNREVAIVLETCLASPATCGWGTDTTATAVDQGYFSKKPLWAMTPTAANSHYFLDAGRHGALTYHLVRGLVGEADGSRDHQQDGWVDFDEAFHYTQTAYRKLGWPEPLLSFGNTFRLSKGGGNR